MRYLLAVFPAFPALAVLTRGRARLFVAVLPLFALNLLLLWEFWEWFLSV
jgi:hypothetical protein